MFDPDLGLPYGERTRLVDRVWTAGRRHQFSVSDAGDIAFARGPYGRITKLVWVDRDGQVEPLPFPPRAYANFRISPDGSKIAVSWKTADDDQRLWILDPDPVRPAFDELSGPGSNKWPAWSPDGGEVVFLACLEKDCALSILKVGASTDPRVVARTGAHPGYITPDGSAVLVSDRETILRIALTEQGSVDTLVSASGTALDPSLSPDGRFFGYTSDVTGRFEVYVEPLPQTGDRWPASVGGGEEIIWSRDGSEIYYRYGRRLFAVEISSDTPLTFGEPRVIYEGPFSNMDGTSYDVGPDGRPLILVPAEEPDDLDHIHFISREWQSNPGEQSR